ncbi:MAG: glycosyltransferase family 2 protein [Eubacteriales bacterium]|nr:glycosyltransferase family 2 protein [Eubacteriales bacterium]MDD3882139.1 glycosyltransferase family 2 protein [Eubacteriales bacterium]MDD4513244.1 glycosyltransferase family 2 protein [Eubacteriales bacterium]
MKQLSIIVPAYNVEKYLEKTLASLSVHELSDKLEVLVINDGSKDSTESIARRFCEAEPQIFRLIGKENGGHGSAVNEGMKRMEGRYARVIDGDDWADRNALTRLISALESTDADLIIDERTEYSEKTSIETRFPLPEKIKANEKTDFAPYAEKSMIPFYTIHTITMKRELIRNRNIVLDEGMFYVDYELALCATSAAQTVFFMRNDVHRYRIGVNTQSVSNESYVRNYRMHRRVVAFAASFAEAGNYNESRSEYVRASVVSIINMHLNILLILDKNKKRGRERAYGFMLWLNKKHPHFEKAAKKRYLAALALNLMSVGGNGLERLRGVISAKKR